MADLTNVEKGRIVIESADGTDWSHAQKVMANSWPVVIASDQTSIPVTTTPATPAGTTSVIQSNQETVTKVGGTGGFSWTIPSGETVVLLSFIFTGSVIDGTVNPIQSKAELYYRPNGAGSPTGEVKLDTIYLCNQSFGVETFQDGAVEHTGDGTAVYEVEITNWSKDDAEFEPRFTGYY